MPSQRFDSNPFNIPLRPPAACKDLFKLFYTLADSLKVLLFFTFPWCIMNGHSVRSVACLNENACKRNRLASCKMKARGGLNFHLMANLPLTRFNFLDSDYSVKCDWQGCNSAEELTPPAHLFVKQSGWNKKTRFDKDKHTFGNVFFCTWQPWVGQWLC